jgi:cytochrome c oxidase subunit 1
MSSLIIPKDRLNKHVFFLWLILAVVALAASVIYSFLPFALRTPFLAKLINLQDFFKVSLVVHVNLAVLVWFLSSTAMLMNLIIKSSLAPFSFTAFIASMIGSAFMIASPFVGVAEPILNNYVPILHNLAFILGISLFLSGILLQVILALLSYNQIKKNLINFTIYITGLIFLVALVCLIKSAIELRILAKGRFIDLIEYYELLFWGAGHVLQFNYIQLLLVVWFLLADKLAPNFNIKNRNLFILQILNFVLVSTSIFAYWIYPFDSVELHDFFTLHMKYTGGILIAIIAIWLCINCRFKQTLEFTIFSTSLFLLTSGGIIGYLINGANVTVPAHYHGVIIGITVALMGMFYILLPELGFNKVDNRQAKWQMLLYTVGQFIHVLALAISGGYGALRKTPGSELSVKAKIFMSMMGIGGIIALIGGVMFVVLIFKNIRVVTKNEQQAN